MLSQHISASVSACLLLDRSHSFSLSPSHTVSVSLSCTVSCDSALRGGSQIASSACTKEIAQMSFLAASEVATAAAAAGTVATSGRSSRQSATNQIKHLYEFATFERLLGLVACGKAGSRLPQVLFEFRNGNESSKVTRMCSTNRVTWVEIKNMTEID